MNMDKKAWNYQRDRAKLFQICHKVNGYSIRAMCLPILILISPVHSPSPMPRAAAYLSAANSLARELVFSINVSTYKNNTLWLEQLVITNISTGDPHLVNGWPYGLHEKCKTNKHWHRIGVCETKVGKQSWGVLHKRKREEERENIHLHITQHNTKYTTHNITQYPYPYPHPSYSWKIVSTHER
jgi:hypothetical protein